METQIRLRAARRGDAQALSSLALRSKAYWGYSPTFMQQCQEELCVRSPDIETLRIAYTVAETDNVIVGFSGVRRLSETDYELEALFVEPAFIGNGIGRALLQHALATIHAHKGSSLLVQSDPNAADFYRACGGIKTGESESLSVAGRLLPVFRFETGRTHRGA